MVKNLIVPQTMVEFLNINDASEVEYKKQPDRTVIIRKKHIPKLISEAIILQCKEYIYQEFLGNLRMEWDFNISFNRKNLRTTVQMTNRRTGCTSVGRTKLNTSTEIYESVVGVAIALCRAVNGKHCDYQKIIGFRMK